MNITYLSEKQLNIGTVVAVGKFDGVHIGHAKLIKCAVKAAHNSGLAAVVYTVAPTNTNMCITNSTERAELFRTMGVDVLCTDVLTVQYSKQTPEEFVKNVLINTLNAKYVVAGYNFRFGCNRSGDTKLLEKLCLANGIKAEIINCVFDSKYHTAVSSTYIKQLISNGEIDKVKYFLGRNFTMSGNVSGGNRIGRTIGFPTINLYFNKDIVKPKNGVYYTIVQLDGIRRKGITNVGFNPTVSNTDVLKVETHIIDYSDDAYGKDVKIEFLKFIREEKKFPSIEHLKKQLEYDIDYVKKTENTINPRDSLF